MGFISSVQNVRSTLLSPGPGPAQVLIKWIGNFAKSLKHGNTCKKERNVQLNQEVIASSTSYMSIFILWWHTMYAFLTQGNDSSSSYCDSSTHSNWWLLWDKIVCKSVIYSAIWQWKNKGCRLWFRPLI